MRHSLHRPLGDLGVVVVVGALRYVVMSASTGGRWAGSASRCLVLGATAIASAAFAGWSMAASWGLVPRDTRSSRSSRWPSTSGLPVTCPTAYALIPSRAIRAPRRAARRLYGCSSVERPTACRGGFAPATPRRCSSGRADWSGSMTRRSPTRKGWPPSPHHDRSAGLSRSGAEGRLSGREPHRRGPEGRSLNTRAPRLRGPVHFSAHVCDEMHPVGRLRHVGIRGVCRCRLGTGGSGWG